MDGLGPEVAVATNPRNIPGSGRALDALVEARLMGASGANPPHYSSSHAASLALEQALAARGWRRSYARGRTSRRAWCGSPTRLAGAWGLTGRTPWGTSAPQGCRRS